jgi:signal transduction histidine kinase
VAVELKVLFVEDDESDVMLVIRELQRAGFAPSWERVETADTLRSALARGPWDLVISDSSMAGLSVMHALATTKATAPKTPFIVLSGGLVEAMGLQAIQEGASDALSKDDLGSLGPAVLRALHRTPEVSSVAHLLLATQELERRRIARALHDDLGQHLVALRRMLESPHDSATAIALVDQALAQARNFAIELWPTVLDDLGLAAALRWLAERHTRGELAFRLAIDRVPRLAFAIETACFRIAQEAITNVERHATARQVDLTLRLAGREIELEIRDDGAGFDVDRIWSRARGASIGLFAMRERAALAGGRLEVVSAIGRGTAVRARFPGEGPR